MPPTPDEVIEEAVIIPAAPTFSEEDLAIATLTAKQEGYADGFEAGLARAAEQADAQRVAIDTVIIEMGKQLQSLGQHYQQLLTRESESLTQLVLMIARKVAGEALEANSAQTILSLVTQCLPVILSKPRLNVELHPVSFERAIGPIELLLQTSGYEGEIQFRTNPALGAHDAVLEWGAGGANRTTATLWHEIETLLGTMPVTLAPLAIPGDTTPQITPPETPAAQNDSAHANHPGE